MIDLSAPAYLDVKQASAKVALDKLESYHVTSDQIPAIGYTVAPASAAVEYTVQKSGGTIPLTLPAPTGLKDVHALRA